MEDILTECPNPTRITSGMKPRTYDLMITVHGWPSTLETIVGSRKLEIKTHQHKNQPQVELLGRQTQETPEPNTTEPKTQENPQQETHRQTGA